MKRTWDQQRAARFIAAWNGGLSMHAMAERFGVTPAAVRGRIAKLRAAGVELRSGEMQDAIAQTRRAKARRRLRLSETNLNALTE